MRPNRVRDVGYDVGAEITRRCNVHALEKGAAVRALRALKDPAAIPAAGGEAARSPATDGAR